MQLQEHSLIITAACPGNMRVLSCFDVGITTVCRQTIQYTVQNMSHALLFQLLSLDPQDTEIVLLAGQRLFLAQALSS